MTHHNSVAFISSTQCSLAYTCHGSIKLQMVPNATATFTPISMSLSAGWMPNNVTVIGYSHSKFVGRLTWKLTITAHTSVSQALGRASRSWCSSRKSILHVLCPLGRW